MSLHALYSSRRAPAPAPAAAPFSLRGLFTACVVSGVMAFLTLSRSTLKILPTIVPICCLNSSAGYLASICITCKGAVRMLLVGRDVKKREMKRETRAAHNGHVSVQPAAQRSVRLARWAKDRGPGNGEGRHGSRESWGRRPQRCCNDAATQPTVTHSGTLLTIRDVLNCRHTAHATGE